MKDETSTVRGELGIVVPYISKRTYKNLKGHDVSENM